MDRPRAADDFAAIRARMEELKREREQVARDGDKKPIDARRRQIAEDARDFLKEATRVWPVRLPVLTLRCQSGANFEFRSRDVRFGRVDRLNPNG